MLYGQIKISALTYDPQEGLRFDADHMWDHPIPNLTFKNDLFTDEAPDQFTIRAHGTGLKDHGQIISQFGGGNEVVQFTDGKDSRPFNFFRSSVPEGLTDNVDNKHVDTINAHKDKIKKVLSFACNPAATMTPEMYEKMMGHDLEHVSMTPPGKNALSLSPTSNYASWLVSRLKPGTDAIHDYSKVNGQWVDQGLYNTKLDNGLEVGAAVGAPVLAYGAYKDYKDSEAKEKQRQKRQPEYYGQLKYAGWFDSLKDLVSKVPVIKPQATTTPAIDFKFKAPSGIIGARG